ncbi:hypothetical protein [Rhodoferax sp.]|uniref:hypothetical protein n=1 Tax=Rhodoferax sp. TaxID=50421 RepID=UPI002728FB00|nr:hypothetical protein [Rhodoferax sp.]MDO9144243.1 hypothetical protein [Rhodoferax sp.]
MSQEGQLLDKKSLRAVLGKTANWSELAKDCIAFANALGEIHPKQVKRTLEELTAKGDVRFEGDKRWRRYWVVQR